MILSTQHELRLYSPNNAIDDVTIWAGYLDESEKDFLVDKLGTPLYDRLCEYYESIDPEEYYQSVLNGTYKTDPWKVLLRNVQVMVVNYTLYRNYYSLILTINGTSINIVQSNDFGAADRDLLTESVKEYKNKAFTNLNTLLRELEQWAKLLATPMPIPDGEASDELDDTPEAEPVDANEAIKEIILLWQKSKYFYLQADLLIPTAEVLQRYLDFYENRDKFIRLLPDLHFIQNQYITKAIGVEQLHYLLTLCVQEQNNELDKYSEDGQYLDDVRYLMTAYLEQRTTVLTIDKTRRQQAHDEAISLKSALLEYIKEKQKAQQQAEETPSSADALGASDNTEKKSFQNNRQGSKIFVSPMLY